MILTCNECETKFLVQAEQLGEKGRRVRCGNCSAVWFVKPPEPETVAEEKKVEKEQKENLKEAVAQKAAGVEPSLPSTVVTQPVPKWLKAAVVVLVFANALAFVVLNKKMIGQTSFYDMLGQYETKGLEISAASVSFKEEEGKKVAELEWAIENTSDERRDLPARRIKILDKDLNVLVKNSDRTSVILEPGRNQEVAPSKLPSFDGKAKYIILEIGNPYELSLR